MRHTVGGHVVDLGRVLFCRVKVVDVVLRHVVGLLLSHTRDIGHARLVIIELLFTLDGRLFQAVGEVQAIGFPVTGGKVDGRELHARLVLGAALTEDVDRVGLAHFKFGGCFDDHHRAVRILRRAFLAVGQVLRFQFCQIRQAVVKARVAVCCVDCRNDAAEYDGA